MITSASTSRARSRIHDERPIGTLLRSLSHESTSLLQQEIELAKTELSDKAACVGRNVGYLAVGGMVAYAGVLVLLAAAVTGLYVLLTVAMDLSPAIALWLSPLI